MSATKTEPRVAALGRFVRGWRLDRNPLRRTTDRMETALLAVLVLAFLIGTPFAALAAGAWANATAQRVQSAQEADRTQVTAVVVAAPTANQAGGWSLSYHAQARWQAPDGRPVSGRLTVSSDTTVGDKLQVWTDHAGAVTTAPLQDSEVTEQVILAELGGAVVVAGSLALIGAVARRELNQRRMAQWDADWHATGPRWTTHA